MKHECMVTTLRLSSNHSSGSCQTHRGRKKRNKFKAMSSPCWSFFNIQGTVHKEFVPRGQTVNGKFYCKILEQLGKGIQHNVQKSGRKTTGFSTMTMRLLTHHSFDNSWLPKTLQWSPPLHLTSPPATFSYSPRWNYAERASFWHDWGDPRTNPRGYRHTHIWELPGMHEIMGNKLGSLYTCPKGLLQMRWWKLGVTVRNCFLWSNSLNFWVAPRIYDPWHKWCSRYESI